MQPITLRAHLKESSWAGSALIFAWAALLIYFYGLHQAYGPALKESALSHLKSSWNGETEYEHGFFVPILMLGLLWADREKLLSTAMSRSGNLFGLGLVLLGILFYVASIRTIQWRLAVGSLPVIVLGSSLYLCGWGFTKRLLFPVSLLYFAIPMPGLLQATNGLQLLATKAAFHLSSLCGVKSVIAGNQIASAADRWGFDVAEGCSGLRSLMALTLVGALYAYMTQRVLWKGLVLFAATFPLAIVANSLRITTIVLLAEYVSPEFAGGLYHDWSGFVFFIVIGLAGLLLVHRLLDMGHNRISRKIVSKAVAEPVG